MTSTIAAPAYPLLPQADRDHLADLWTRSTSNSDHAKSAAPAVRTGDAYGSDGYPRSYWMLT
jgi:hypothetical protein